MRAIGPPLTAEESAAFVAAARSCMGVRFRHQGRNPAIGLDCAGLPQWAMQQIGRPIWDIHAYGTEPHKDGLYEAMVRNMGGPVPLKSIQPGDVVLMRFHGAPRHVGIVTDLGGGRLGLLHVHAENKYVAEHGLAGYHADLVAAFRP
ncbi:glycoside hydrolase [Pseudoxanthomonas sacheonensis]|nr:glycoside hydrolase [Pseudoxanthomonas sacheonensis]